MNRRRVLIRIRQLYACGAQAYSPAFWRSTIVRLRRINSSVLKNKKPFSKKLKGLNKNEAAIRLWRTSLPPAFWRSTIVRLRRINFSVLKNKKPFSKKLKGLNKNEAATYSPAFWRSTIGLKGLNFSVRNGKR